MIAYAQSSTELAHSFVAQINQIILFPLITLLTAVALLIFLWGGFQYVYNAANESKRAEGRKHILWGLVGLLVMLSAYAILNIAANTFGIDVDQYNRVEQSTFNDETEATLPDSNSGYAPINSPTPQQRPSGNAVGDSGNLEATVINEMQAAGVADWEQDLRLSAMTTGNEDNRRAAIEDVYERGYISSQTRADLLSTLE